MKITPHPSEGM